MANPLPTGDPARDALNMSEEILARLDAATAPQSEPAAMQPEEAPPATAPLDEQLRTLEAKLNEALDRSDKDAARRIVQEAKDAVRSEKSRREKALEDAQEDFDQLLKEEGGESAATMSAAREVELWKKSLNGYDDYIGSVDAFYDEVISGIDIDDGSVATTVRPGFDEKPKQLAELLQALDDAEAAYRARLEEIKVEKQDIAARIIQERIQQEKAKIGAA